MEESNRDVRVCGFPLCKRPIPSIRGAHAKFCSRFCADDMAATKRKKSRDPGDVIVHQCLISEFDSFNSKKCRCRLRLSDAEIEKLFRQGEARNLNVEHRRILTWDHGDVFLVGKRHRTPRASTIEAPHIRRGSEYSVECAKKTAEKLQADFESLKRRIQFELVEKAEEENIRWDVWADLQRQFYRSLTVEISDVEWRAGERESRGVPVVPLPVAFDLRTPHGIGTNVAPTALQEEAA